MAKQEAEIADVDVGPLRKQYNLFLGVWSQFWYVGAQVAIAGYFINYAQEVGKTQAQGCMDSPQFSFHPYPLIDAKLQPTFSPLPKASMQLTVSLPRD